MGRGLGDTAAAAADVDVSDTMVLADGCCLERAVVEKGLAMCRSQGGEGGG